jgi:hypothetical protein
LASRKYTLTQVFGIWVIFASILPLITSSSYILFFIGSPIQPLYFGYLDSFVLISPIIMVILGWGLYKNHPAARIGMICYLLLTLIVSFGSYYLGGPFLVGSNITLILLILGGLILSNNRKAHARNDNQSVALPSEIDDP